MIKWLFIAAITRVSATMSSDTMLFDTMLSENNLLQSGNIYPTSSRHAIVDYCPITAGHGVLFYDVIAPFVRFATPFP